MRISGDRQVDELRGPRGSLAQIHVWLPLAGRKGSMAAEPFGATLGWYG